MGLKDRLEKISQLDEHNSAASTRFPNAASKQKAGVTFTPETTAPTTSPEKQHALDELRTKIDAIMNKNSLVPPTPSVRREAHRRYIVPAPRSDNWETTQCPPSRSSSLPPPGREISNKHGCFLMVEETLPASYSHGKCRIGDFSETCANALSLLANQKTIGNCRCTDALFLDLETTGLAGGVGTFPFMIGIGWLDGENGSFIIEQLFARDFSEEKACLTYLLEAVAARSFLITFNGKAYDVNLLATRLTLNRLMDNLTEMPHLDLLHPCRRLFKHRLENCSLTNMETQILGHFRSDDIPGFEIPQRYFAWLRRREPSLISDIFYHNRLDIISMAGLAWSLSKMLVEGKTASERDTLNVERLKIERTGNGNDIEGLMGLSESSDRTVALEAMEMLAMTHKKEERWQEAVAIWEKIIANYPRHYPVVIELSKFYEHKERHYRKALATLEGFIKKAGFIPRFQREELEQRTERLKKKIRRALEHQQRDLCPPTGQDCQ